MSYRTILVDLDDTLVIEEKSAHHAFLCSANYLKQLHDINNEEFVTSVRSAARELWYSLPTINYAKEIGLSSWEALWADFSSGDDNQKELNKHKDFYQHNTWYNALLKYNIKNKELASVLSSIYINERKDRHIPFDDTNTFLNRLTDLHLKIVLVTNGTPDLQWQKIKKSGIEKYFYKIIISGEYGYKKPTKEIFLYCVNIANGTINNSIMIGNNLETDVKGANETGITSVWLNREFKENNTGIYPTYEFNNLYDVIKIIE